MNFTTSFLVSQTPDEVFAAINKVSEWWQGEIEGNTTQCNDEFIYRMQPFHVSKQKIVEMIPAKKIVWLVTESNLSFITNHSEWIGTSICFDISEHDNQTQVLFTHIGLQPEIECYEQCSNAWSQLIQQSLYSLITTGKGKKVF